jgi:hypothetical protein
MASQGKVWQLVYRHDGIAEMGITHRLHSLLTDSSDARHLEPECLVLLLWTGEKKIYKVTGAFIATTYMLYAARFIVLT